MAKKRKINPELFDKNPIHFNQKEIRTIRNVLDSFDEDQKTLFYGFIGAFVSERTDLCNDLINEITLYLKSKRKEE